MVKLQFQVREFMDVFDQPYSDTPRIPDKATFDLSLHLIAEELGEFKESQTIKDRKDALGDLLYVIYWAANAHGILIAESITSIGVKNPTPKMPGVSTFQFCANQIQRDLDTYRSASTVETRGQAVTSMLMSTYYAAALHGIDTVPVTDEIHRSNMTKLWTDDEIKDLPEGLYIAKSFTDRGERAHVVKNKATGKGTKSPSYSPAQL